MKLERVDPEVFEVVQEEKERQQNEIELIASENFVSPAVMEAVGSVLTNKYAEGLPGKRYYGGCDVVDKVENLAIERLKKLFRLEGYACNVQPHSGSAANMAVMLACLQPGDTILSMDLSAGGHLSHGCKVNFSGKWFHVVSYGVDDEGLIDYEDVARKAKEHQPKLIIAGASAYPRVIDFEKFREIAGEAYLLADIAHIAGLIVAGLHPSPVGYADFITTTTHKTLRGTRGGVIMVKEELGKKMNSAVFPGMQGGPLMHAIAGKAVAFYEALQPSFLEYQKQILRNCKAMEETFSEEGIAMVSGGSDNHLLLLDLRSLNITGKEAEERLGEVNITLNKNGIPHDPQPPKVTSGVRIGTPAVTTRGFKEEECKKVAQLIGRVLKGNSAGVKEEVARLCQQFPLYDE